MSRFFIDRPIFAWVIAIVIMMAGIFAMLGLPIEQYPEIAPTQISVNANYPGASPETIEQSVTQVIEQAMKGIDNVVYMTGNASQGGGGVSIVFETGTDPDIAQVQVQNKLQQALRSLPQPVQAQGVNVTKGGTGFLAILAFYIEDENLMTRAELNDYVSTVVADAVGRIDGVGSARAFGSQNAMRIWLDPYKLNQYKLMPADVRSAILSQNAQISTGRLGDLPATQGQPITATITAQGRLQTPQQFRDIVLRVNQDGSSVKVSDVARVEIGRESYGNTAWLDGKAAVGFGVNLASGANALATAEAVLARMAELEKFFPPGMKWVSSVDNAQFIRTSIMEVLVTLLEAVAMVVLIMYLFLGSWRATLIPAIAVPVVLLGTLGVLSVFGYSINTLTMFAMVLAIGLLVDDAIVVVENVERLMHEEHLSPLEATRKSMDQITGALLGVALVLAAVFVPMSFFGGSTGAIYRQFSVTIASAMGLSVLVALVLSPALCATLLKPPESEVYGRRRGPLFRFFHWFNGGMQKATLRYQGMVKRMLPHLGMGFAAYALLTAASAALLLYLPTSFLPEEDQGNLNVSVQLPPGSTQERTNAVLAQVMTIVDTEKDAYRLVMPQSGMGGAASGQASGQVNVRLKHWDLRTPEQSATALVSRLNGKLSSIRDADVTVRNPPVIRGLGNTNGFSLELQDLGGLGYEGLTDARDQFLQLAAGSSVLANVRAQGTDVEPEYHVSVDLNKAAALGLTLGDVNDTLSSALGGNYVNDFINKGRVKKVYMQGDAPYRMQPGDLEGWFVRNRASEMVPLASIATGQWTVGPPRLQRYNGTASLSINGLPTEGYSSGDAMAEVERLMTQMPEGIGYAWSGVSYQERLAGTQAPLLYAVSIVFVFLCLAALYESWAIPFSVMLVVPLGVLGALIATALRGLDNDVYFQVGLITTIGLSAKNAILIVEFAKKLMEEGLGLVEATLQAVRIRLRPILMTSLAFMLGVLPLMLGTGAGAASRHAIGTGVFGGMLTAMLFGLLFVPLFFVFVQKVFVRQKPAAAPATAAATPV